MMSVGIGTERMRETAKDTYMRDKGGGIGEKEGIGTCTCE